MTKASGVVLSSHKPGSPLYSPVLENTLSQIQTSSAYPITPTSLTHPVHVRRLQLSYPTNTLHSTAQRVVIGMGTSVLAGFGTAWAGWAEKFGVLGSTIGPSLEVETAVGTGMLMSAVGVWWMVGWRLKEVMEERWMLHGIGCICSGCWWGGVRCAVLQCKDHCTPAHCRGWKDEKCK